MSLAYKQGDIIETARNGDVKQLEQCINNGANVDEQDSDGNTPLMYAVVKGHKAAVDFLIAHKANVNHTNKYGHFALYIAAYHGYHGICEVLLKAGADKTMKCEGITAARLAKDKGLAAFIELWGVQSSPSLPSLPSPAVVSASQPKYKEGDIIIAAIVGDVKQLEQCIKNDANVDEQNENGNTALLLAVSNGHKAAVEFLIARKANVNHTSHKYGQFALYLAAYDGDKDICEVLLKAGADKNMKDKWGQTAAQWAAEQGHKELAAFIESWGKVSVASSPSSSPLPALSASTSNAFAPSTAIIGPVLASSPSPLSSLFAQLSLTEYVAAFDKEKFVPTDLPLLSPDELKELIPHAGPRKRLEQWIKQQQQPTSTDAEIRKAIEHAAAAEKRNIEEKAEKEKKALDEKAMKLAEENAKLKAKALFLDSIAGSYAKKNLKFQVTSIDLVPPSAAHARYEAAKQKLRELKLDIHPIDVEDRFVFHSCPPATLPLICANTLRPSICAKCKSGRECEDPGFFGNHTCGVYVSKHADYTVFYVRRAEAKEGDTGSTIVLKCVTGRRKHFSEMPGGIDPTPGFHCHESPNHLEFFIFNPDQVVPVYVVHWKVITSTRADILHEI